MANAEPTPTPPKPKQAPPTEAKLVKLRYLGSSDRCVDDVTGFVFDRDGEPHDVSEANAVRLESFNPYSDRFERVS